jgi:hypothetical protein
VEIFEALERDAAAIGRDITGAFRHRHTSAAQPAAAVTIKATTPGGPVTNVLTDIKAGAHDLIDKLESLDEGAIGVVEAIKVNPTAIGITNTLASIAHLPDPQGLLGTADGLLKQLAALLSKGAADTALTAPDGQPAPDPSFAPAGPQVAGQA